MLKRLPTDQLEEESKLALEQFFNEVNWKPARFTDDKFAIDGEIRVVQGIEITGKGFKYQLKAGKSYITRDTTEAIRVRVERKYVDAWLAMDEPVVLFFYEPTTKIIYWKAVQPFIRVQSALLKKPGEYVVIPFNKKRDLLDRSAFGDLTLVASSEFQYHKIIYAEDEHELMISNRFPILHLPQFVCAARTEYTYQGNITSELKDYYAFWLEPGKDGKGHHTLWTFSDLANPNVELRRFCEAGAAERFNVSDISPAKFVTLLNKVLFINAIQMDLLAKGDRFAFSPRVLKSPETNKFKYIALKGGEEERTKIYIQHLNGRTEYKHHAVKLRVVNEDGQWFLEIEPDWYFSYPGQEVSRQEIGRRITKEKADTQNGPYRYDLHFWKCYLSKNDPSMVFPVDSLPGSQQMTASIESVSFASSYRLVNDYDGPRDVVLN
jgi:hypothetical protein